jgi:hypothetical protein
MDRAIIQFLSLCHRQREELQTTAWTDETESELVMAGLGPIGAKIKRRVPAECVRAFGPNAREPGSRGHTHPTVVSVAPGSRIFARACKPALARPGHANS